MRLAIISDIHGNLLALEAVLADLRRRSPDLIVNLGDCVTSPLWPRETLELLETLSLPTVRGNHDRSLATRTRIEMSPVQRFVADSLEPAQVAALGALPATLSLDGGRVLAVHGTERSDVDYLLHELADGRLSLASADTLMRRLGDTTAELVLCGHTHHQHSTMDPRGRFVLNPGAVGCPRYADDAAWRTAEACSPHARYAIATRTGGTWRAEMFVLEYDWGAAAARATENGRTDWADAFLGRIG